jgi:hypothetical protein
MMMMIDTLAVPCLSAMLPKLLLSTADNYATPVSSLDYCKPPTASGDSRFIHSIRCPVCLSGGLCSCSCARL